MRLFMILLGCLLVVNVYAGEFIIKRGVNLSHWLSQTEMRGQDRKEYVTEKDFVQIKELGFDHIRLPIDEEQFWTEKGERIEESFTLLNQAVKWSIKNRLKIIVDLHTLRSHYFNDPNCRDLWKDKDAQDGFIKFWKELSKELKEYPVDMVAYEPMNEAVADDPEDWNRLANRVIQELRLLEPERVYCFRFCKLAAGEYFPCAESTRK